MSELRDAEREIERLFDELSRIGSQGGRFNVQVTDFGPIRSEIERICDQIQTVVDDYQGKSAKSDKPDEEGEGEGKPDGEEDDDDKPATKSSGAHRLYA